MHDGLRLEARFRHAQHDLRGHAVHDGVRVVATFFTTLLHSLMFRNISVMRDLYKETMHKVIGSCGRQLKF